MSDGDADGGGTGAAAGRCGGDAVTLAVTASSEKAQLLRQLAAGYNDEGHAVDGRCVQVEVTSKASGGAMAALAKGWDEAADGPRPDVWTPASSGWVRLLEQRTLAADRPKMIPADTPKIAASPLVIAMPRPMAEALGWPEKQLGWACRSRSPSEPSSCPSSTRPRCRSSSTGRWPP